MTDDFFDEINALPLGDDADDEKRVGFGSANNMEGKHKKRKVCNSSKINFNGFTYIILLRSFLFIDSFLSVLIRCHSLFCSPFMLSLLTSSAKFPKILAFS